MIKKAVFEAHYKSMKQDIENSRKLEDVKHKEFRGVPEYFCDTNLKNARLKFKIRTKLVKPIPGNFQNKYRNTRRYGVSDPTILAYGLNLLPCPALPCPEFTAGEFRETNGRRTEEEEEHNWYSRSMMENGLKCKFCTDNEMSQNHCMKCTGLEEMRRGLEISDINVVVTFFRRYLEEEKDK